MACFPGLGESLSQRRSALSNLNNRVSAIGDIKVNGSIPEECHPPVSSARAIKGLYRLLILAMILERFDLPGQHVFHPSLIACLASYVDGSLAKLVDAFPVLPLSQQNGRRHLGRADVHTGSIRSRAPRPDQSSRSVRADSPARERRPQAGDNEYACFDSSSVPTPGDRAQHVFAIGIDESSGGRIQVS